MKTGLLLVDIGSLLPMELSLGLAMTAARGRALMNPETLHARYERLRGKNLTGPIPFPDVPPPTAPEWCQFSSFE
jgi:hypothetical protein